jgi:hypothetical protein
MWQLKAKNSDREVKNSIFGDKTPSRPLKGVSEEYVTSVFGLEE